MRGQGIPQYGHQIHFIFSFFSQRVASLRPRRCQALYDCDADLDDELSFKEGEIIIVLQAETEDGDWMEGEIEGDPKRRGKVPINFVHMLTD